MIKFFLLTILLLSVHLQEGEGDFEFPEEIQRYIRDQTACGEIQWRFMFHSETGDKRCSMLPIKSDE